MLHAWLMASKVFLLYKAQAYVYFFFALFFKLPPRQLLQIHVFLEIALILNSLTLKLWSLNISCVILFLKVHSFLSPGDPKSPLFSRSLPLFSVMATTLSILRTTEDSAYSGDLQTLYVDHVFSSQPYVLGSAGRHSALSINSKPKKVWRLKNIILTQYQNLKQTDMRLCIVFLSTWIVMYFTSEVSIYFIK